jgi:Flp pilus assembly protein TadD
MPKPRDQEKSGTARWVLLAASLLAVLLGATALAPLRQAEFIQDDHPIVELNPIVHRGNPAEILTSGWWEGIGGSDASLYRPVTILSFALERGPDRRVIPSRGHTINIVLHLLAALALIALARRLGAGALASGMAGLLFAVHPLHLGAVARLVGRAEILAALFTFLALFFVRGDASRGSGPWPWVAGLCTLVALGSKESAAALPLLVVAVDLLYHLPVEHRRRSWWLARLRTVLPTLLATAIYLVARAAALGQVLQAQRVRMSDNLLVSLDGAERAATAIGLAGRYLKLLLLPVPMSPDYSGNVIAVESSLFSILPLLGLSFLGCLVALSVAPFVRRSVRPPDGQAPLTDPDPIVPASAAALLFLLPYLVIGNLVVLVGIIFAERLIYLPSAGFCLLAGLAVGSIVPIADRLRRPLAIAAHIGLGIFVALLLASATLYARGESRHWISEESLWEATIMATPRNPRAHFTLAKIRLDQGRSEEAFPLLERTIALWPQFSAAWFERGLILAERGRMEEAADSFREASRLNPWRAESSLNLALALHRLDRLKEAEAELRQLIERFPQMPKAHAELGHLLFETGRYDEAARAYDRAVELGRVDLEDRSREAKRRALL